MKKQLLESQKELLRIKFALANQAQSNVNITMDRIAMELGIPRQELSQWKIDAELKCFEKKEPLKEVKKTFPKEKDKKQK